VLPKDQLATIDTAINDRAATNHARDNAVHTLYCLRRFREEAERP
jgi:hypothetical protein